MSGAAYGNGYGGSSAVPAVTMPSVDGGYASSRRQEQQLLQSPYQQDPPWAGAPGPSSSSSSGGAARLPSTALAYGQSSVPNGYRAPKNSSSQDPYLQSQSPLGQPFHHHHYQQQHQYQPRPQVQQHPAASRYGQQQQQQQQQQQYSRRPSEQSDIGRVPYAATASSSSPAIDGNIAGVGGWKPPVSTVPSNSVWDTPSSSSHDRHRQYASPTTAATPRRSGDPGRPDPYNNSSSNYQDRSGSGSRTSSTTASPSLPVLNTSTTSAGFGNLYQQLEAEMDMIHQRHSPMASPITPTTTSSSNTTPRQNNSRSNGYVYGGSSDNGSTRYVQSGLAPKTSTSSNNRADANGRDGSSGGTFNGGGLQPMARRQDSDNTVREGYSAHSSPSYGGEGIISMYDTRSPSPGPSYAYSQAATPAASADPASGPVPSFYQSTAGQGLSLSREPVSLASSPSPHHSRQPQNSSASFHATAPEAGSYRQPVSSSSFGAYNMSSDGRPGGSSRRSQGAGSSSVRSQQSAASTSTRSDHSSTSTAPHVMHAVRPLPSSPPTTATSSFEPSSSSLPSSTRTSADGNSYKSTGRQPRPSVESSVSYASSTSYAGAPTSPTFPASSGIVPPRPSMSSSTGSSSSRPSFGSHTDPSSSSSAPSYGRTNVRPLPVPESSLEEPPEQLAGSGYTYSPDLLDGSRMPASASAASSSYDTSGRDRDPSDFTREFYASGSSVPDNVRWPNGVPRRVQSQREAAAAVRAASIGRRPTYDGREQRQAERHEGPSKSTAAAAALPPSHSSLSTMSASSMATLSTSPSSLSPGPPHPQSHLHHSHSDPVANATKVSSSASTSSASATPPPRLRNVSLNGPTAPSSGLSYSHSSASTSSSRNVQPNYPTSRSASFSTSSSSAARPEGASRRNVSLGSASARNAINRMPSVPEPSPPLPSSPSISISTSLYDTSITSTHSYASVPASTSSSAYASALRKQASLSPSNFSLSAQGFVSARPKDNADQERRRMEGLGLQHLNPAFLSNLAVALKDRVPRSENVKGSITYPASFTGDQVVSCLAEILPYPYTDDRRFAAVIARNLLRNMYFHEVEWDETRVLRDSQEQVFCFEEEEQQATFDYLDGNFDGLPTSSGFNNRTMETSRRLQEEVPNGVITRFTKCYSPFCGVDGTSGSGACYSLYCPNGAHPLGLQRKQSAVSLSPSTEEPPAEAWASNVSQALRDQIGPREEARQGVIFELIKGEQEYKKDLDMLETAFAESLRSANPPVIDPQRLPEFLNQAFANLDEVRGHSGEMINSFQVRQREQNPVVESIGDLVLDAALQWGQAYIDYAEAQVMGEYVVNEEKANNPTFAAFLQSRREAFGIKHDFRHYHLRATIRLQRYLLLLAEYLKRTPEDHPDREPAQEAVRIIRQQCDACNAAVASAQLKLACVQYDKLIERDFNYVNDLDLLHPSRQLFQHGKMFAKPEGARSEWTEYQVMLFDHYLVIAKPRRTAPGYRLIRKPIRLDMLTVSGWDEPPIIRSSGFHLSSVIRTGERRDNGQTGQGDRTESKAWPVVFRISGRLSGTLSLYVESSKTDRDGLARQEWKAKLDQAIAVRRAALDANKVFKLNLLMDPDVRQSSNTGAGLSTMGKTLSSCPFVGPAGQKLIAIGTSSGLFITLRKDPGSIRQILQIPVQHCAVLQEFGIFLIRTEGRLLSYLLETLVQSSSSESKGQQGPQQVSGQKDILFFKVGRVGLRTLVVYAKKDGVSNTVLKAMEPVANIERSRVQHSRFLGMGGKKTEWFRLFKDASVPTEVYGLTFTRSKLALVCAPGFEILDIDTLKTGSFPDWSSIKGDPTRYDSQMASLQRRCIESRAVGLFRISDQEFLFCYEDFAFFADRHGDPVRARFGDFIEWEGRPDTVVYCRPYVLAFDTRFVEVRDTSQRGKLVQIIRGNNIRCTYDGQGLPSIEVDVRQGGVREPLERLPHLMMMVNNVEKLYELAPIVE